MKKHVQTKHSHSVKKEARPKPFTREQEAAWTLLSQAGMHQEGESNGSGYTWSLRIWRVHDTPALRRALKLFPELEAMPIVYWDDKFAWFADCHEFLASTGGLQIQNAEDAKVHVIDQFLKLTMDGLKKHHPAMLHSVGGSPLIMLRVILDSAVRIWQKEKPSYNGMSLEVLQFMQSRVVENLQLRDHYKAGGPQKARAGMLLRQRGLLF